MKAKSKYIPVIEWIKGLRVGDQMIYGIGFYEDDRNLVIKFKPKHYYEIEIEDGWVKPTEKGSIEDEHTIQT